VLRARVTIVARTTTGYAALGTRLDPALTVDAHLTLVAFDLVVDTLAVHAGIVRADVPVIAFGIARAPLPGLGNRE
jgi:hypothetical protein